MMSLVKYHMNRFTALDAEDEWNGLARTALEYCGDNTPQACLIVGALFTVIICSN